MITAPRKGRGQEAMTLTLTALGIGGIADVAVVGAVVVLVWRLFRRPPKEEATRPADRAGEGYRIA